MFPTNLTFTRKQNVGELPLDFQKVFTYHDEIFQKTFERGKIHLYASAINFTFVFSSSPFFMHPWVYYDPEFVVQNRKHGNWLIWTKHQRFSIPGGEPSVDKLFEVMVKNPFVLTQEQTELLQKNGNRAYLYPKTLQGSYCLHCMHGLQLGMDFNCNYKRTGNHLNYQQLFHPRKWVSQHPCPFGCKEITPELIILTESGAEDLDMPPGMHLISDVIVEIERQDPDWQYYPLGDHEDTLWYTNLFRLAPNHFDLFNTDIVYHLINSFEGKEDIKVKLLNDGRYIWEFVGTESGDLQKYVVHFQVNQGDVKVISVVAI